jgi:sigma-B regulation protein RsbU (phosphoserine phosphatase)
MRTLFSQFFVPIQRTTKQPLARLAIIGILAKLALDSVSVIMPASLEWLLMPFIPLLGIGSLVIWVAAVEKDEEKIDCELSEKEQPLQLSSMIGNIAFIVLIVLIASNVTVSLLGSSSMTIISMAIFDMLILAFIAITGDIFRILRRLLILRRSSSTKLTMRVTLLFVLAFLFSSTLHFVFGVVDAMAIVISSGGLAAVWFFLRLNQNDWINALPRKDKIFLLRRTIFSLFTCLLVPGLLIHDSVDGNNGLESAYMSIGFCVVFASGIYGAALSRLFFSILFSLPTAQFIDRRNYEVESLIELNRLALSDTSIENIVTTIMFRAMEATRAEGAWCEALAPQSSDYIVLASAVLTDEHIAWFHRSSEFESKVLRSQEQILISNVEDDHNLAYLAKFPQPLARSVLAMPLFAGQKRVAMLVLVKRDAYGFQGDDLRILRAFQHNVKIALDNAKLLRESIENERIKRELSLASSMQNTMLPQKLPEIAEFDIDIRCVPAAEVGGDYYDFVQLENGMWCLIIGDVSGKGIPAAFYMAHVKGIVLSLAGMAKSPSDFLLKVNNALYGNMEKHAYITMSVCMFDTDAKELVLVRGGHCPTFLKQNRAVAVVTPKGLGIGLAANSLFVPTLQEMHIPYSEGDIAYFFTDGVSEAKNTIDEEFGYEPILDVLRGVQDGETSKVINETIMHEVRSFVGTAPQHDDITSVVVRCVQSKAQNSLVTSSSNGEYQTVER